MSGLRWLLLGLFAMVSAGCTGSALRAQRLTVADNLSKIEKQGYRCAERDLAMAQANLEFTRLELAQGAYFRAKEHLKLAKEHYGAVEAVSKRPECQENQDRDGDGIFDRKDLCPDDPEDMDNYEDEDGCPEDQDTDGDGIPDSKDQCPNDPEDLDGVEDEDGCPDLPKDRDGDGIMDQQDKCPDDPEDKDGFQDEDGCPDPDNDQDKILDVNDQCPLQPEDYDGDADEDGCPDLYRAIVVTKDKIELKQKVFFATNKAKILRKSHDLLNEVAQALMDRKEIRVRIEGHTDSRGSARYNKKLSDRRAASVRSYLIGRGVEPDRMESIGYGEENPIEDNSSVEGRAANRRVEFFIIK